jgi:hypothetical protein
MKIKVAIASLAVASVVVAAFAFTTKRTQVTQYLDDSLVQSVFVNALQSDIATAGNWSTSLGYTLGTGSKLGAIEFNQESASDGSGDGMLSKAEAVQAVYDYYVAHGNDLPTDGNAISVQVSGSTGNTAMNITIRRKS